MKKMPYSFCLHSIGTLMSLFFLNMFISCKSDVDHIIDEWVYVSDNNTCGDRDCKEKIPEVAFICCLEHVKNSKEGFIIFEQDGHMKAGVRLNKSDKIKYEEIDEYYFNKDQLAIVLFYNEEGQPKFPQDTLYFHFEINNDTLVLSYQETEVDGTIAYFVRASQIEEVQKMEDSNCEFLVGDWVQDKESESMSILGSEWRLHIENIEGTLIYKTGRVPKDRKDIPGSEVRSEGRIICTNGIPYLSGMGLVEDQEIKVIRNGDAILFGTNVYIRKNR